MDSGDVNNDFMALEATAPASAVPAWMDAGTVAAGASMRCGARPARGFAFVAALFLLVVLGALGAFVVSISANAQATSSLAVQGVRAFEAANAGVEWATYQALDPAQAIWGQVTTPPPCFTTPSTLALPSAFAGLSVSVTCTRYPASTASPNYYEEGSQRVVIYVLTATASQGTPGSASYIERQIEARVEQCKNPFGTAPAYACS
jgi:MSHA biogenesis protein MshP